MDNMKHRRLQELDRSDFSIVDGEPDIRGWDVKNTSGQKIGEVEELIVDAQQKKVRYMVVDLDDNELKLDHRKVLLPIGLAELDKEDDDVILPNVQADLFRSLPDYERDHLTPDVERQVCTTLGRSAGTTSRTTSQDHDPDFYQHDYFRDDNLYKHRMHEARPVKADSEYDRGLRLWERRSDGGIVQDDRDYRERGERDIEENTRREMVRNRRAAYEQRRGGSGRDQYRRTDNSIESRIRDEGLRDG